MQSAGVETNKMQDDDLNAVCAKSNEWGADVFVSLHCNACEKHNAVGTETWFKSFEGQRLASCIQSQIIRSIATIDRGIKRTDGLWVLNDTDAVSVLVELGFIDNDSDLTMLKYDLDTLVRAIARGVTDYEQLPR